MNILDIVMPLLPVPVIKGHMPALPDDCVGIVEYNPPPPDHYFDGTRFLHNVQVRSRSLTAATAYEAAEACAKALNRHEDMQVSILQTSAVLDIGRDGANPARQEYTVNFTVRRR
ncbi:MAG: hypothetical protein FWE40_05460 [Oscillospiraceae bacterium]|nr:hypothetical protein [Oscillospiraceae bacterium]